MNIEEVTNAFLAGYEEGHHDGKSDGQSFERDNAYSPKENLKIYLNGLNHNNGWIGVDERLPEDGTRILTLSRNGSVNICERERHGDGFQSWYLWVFSKFTGGYYLEENVTHWMPLPAAPKELSHE